MLRLLPVLLLALPIISCATPGHARLSLTPTAHLEGPMEVSILGKRGDVEVTLEEHLRDAGIRVKRFVSTDRVTRPDSAGGIATFNQAATRYVLETDWVITAPCFGGGFRFNRFRVDVIDTRTNEIVMSSKAGGYSEKCQPMSGTIFGDVAKLLRDAWAAPAAQPPVTAPDNH